MAKNKSIKPDEIEPTDEEIDEADEIEAADEEIDETDEIEAADEKPDDAPKKPKNKKPMEVMGGTFKNPPSAKDFLADNQEAIGEMITSKVSEILNATAEAEKAKKQKPKPRLMDEFDFFGGEL